MMRESNTKNSKQSPFYNRDAEMVVCSLIITYGQYAEDICGLLTEAMFHEDDLREVFCAVRCIVAEKKIPDLLTVGNQLRKSDNKAHENILIDLVQYIGSIAMKDEYVRIVQSYYFKRVLFERLTTIASSLNGNDGDWMEAVDNVNATISEIDNQVQRNVHPRTFSEILDENESQLYRRMDCKANNTMPGIDTGITKLNQYTMGWQPSRLMILAARPGMGKTAMALHFCKKAVEKGHPVLFFSLEMSDTQLSERMVLAESKVPADAAKSGEMTQVEIHEYLQAIKRLKKLPIEIIEKSGMEIGDIKRTAKAFHRKKKCDLVIVDYLQLVTVGRNARVGTREQEVSYISRELKGLAKELNVPVLAIAQLSRGVELREDKRPRLADLRESGSIEQDADLVMMLYRAEYYSPNSDVPKSGEILIPKNRDGQPNVCVEFRYNETLTNIYNPEESPNPIALPADAFSNETPSSQEEEWPF